MADRNSQTQEPPERVIALEGLHNLRDLGGYETMSGASTRWRSVLRSDGPAQLGAASQARLIEMGLGTVIDLRSPREVERHPNPFDSHDAVEFHSLPLFGALAPIPTLHNGGRLFDMAARYREALDDCRKAMAQVFAAIAAAGPGMVLFHCSVGKDRTGIIAAILLRLAGVDEDTVIADYALTETVAAPLLDGYRQKALAQGADPALVDAYLGCPPATMRSTLDHLETQHGGAPGYLGGIGLDAGDVARLKARLEG